MVEGVCVHTTGWTWHALNRLAETRMQSSALMQLPVSVVVDLSHLDIVSDQVQYPDHAIVLVEPVLTPTLN